MQPQKIHKNIHDFFVVAFANIIINTRKHTAIKSRYSANTEMSDILVQHKINNENKINKQI